MNIRKKEPNKSLVHLAILFSVCLVIAPFGVRAAVLYLQPASGNYYQGDSFIVEVRIDNEDECVNTVEAHLNFPPDILRIEDISKGNSILSVWIKEPQFSNETGLTSFVGGIPGGYCGPLPGDPTLSNVIARIVFQIMQTPSIEELVEAKVKFLADSQVLLHDGFGTPASKNLKEAVFTILSGIPALPKKEWAKELREDKIPPEPFMIEISQEPSLFEGKYFIVFSTTDKHTGVDYYEVKEGKDDWQRAASPHLLKDQTLKSIIEVRAVDKADNKRIAQYLPAKKPPPYWLIILVLFGLGIIYYLITKITKQN